MNDTGYISLRIPLAIIVLLVMITGCMNKRNAAENKMDTYSDNISTKIDFYSQTTWLLGYLNRKQFTFPPHSAWYSDGYENYVIDSVFADRLKVIPGSNITIKIVMGTWCPDSRREVPRFMRIIDRWGLPESNLTIIGVDDAKLSPVGEYDKLNIQRVPTFIIYKNNLEAGRIIENPVTSLEQDILNILTKE